MKFNTTQLQYFHEGLSGILILLKDNPMEETNPELFERVEDIVKTTRKRIYAARDKDKLGQQIGPEGKYE